MNKSILASLFAIFAAGLLLVQTGCPVTVNVQGPTTYVEQPPEIDEAPAAPAPAMLAQAAAAEPAKKPAEKTAGKKPSDANPASRPKADRTPRKPGEAIKITFDNIILGMQADIPYRPWMMKEDVQELEGKRVSITGVMYDTKTFKKVDNFILLRNSECKYGQGGQADHLADVRLKKGHVFGMTKDTVRIEGVLKVEPYTGDDGNTWRIYVLDDATAEVQ